MLGSVNEFKLHLDVGQSCDNLFGILCVNTLSYRIKTNRSVKRTRVNIDVAELLCDKLCRAALSCACRTVNCNIYSHKINLRYTFSPANRPVEKAICKLNPPVYASTSITSPAK